MRTYLHVCVCLILLGISNIKTKIARFSLICRKKEKEERNGYSIIMVNVELDFEDGKVKHCFETLTNKLLRRGDDVTEKTSTEKSWNDMERFTKDFRGQQRRIHNFVGAKATIC